VGVAHAEFTGDLDMVKDLLNKPAADTAWLRARVAEVTDKVVNIYAHLGIETVDNMGSQQVDDYNK